MLFCAIFALIPNLQMKKLPRPLTVVLQRFNQVGRGLLTGPKDFALQVLYL